MTRFYSTMRWSLLLCATFLALQLNAQGIDEDFQGVPLSNGVGQVPDGWLQLNLDGNTPASNLSFMGNNGWLSAQINQAGLVGALSISWYSPAGTSDDWLITPQVSIDSANRVLIMEALNLNANFPDRLEVLVSNTTTDVDSFALLGTYVASAADVQAFAINLDDYVDQDVYLAFRNTTNDGVGVAVTHVYTTAPGEEDLVVQGGATNFRYSAQGESNDVLAVELSNQSLTAIEAIDITWVSNSDTIVERLTQSIPVLGSAVLNIGVPFEAVSGQDVEYTAFFSSPDLTAESNFTNNVSSTFVLTGVDAGAVKNTFIEEGTGTWCQFCPRGFVAVDNSYDLYDDIVIVAVHNDDPMVLEEYDDEVSSRIGGYPGVVMDRFFGDLSVPVTPQGGTSADITFGDYRDFSRTLIAPVSIDDVTAMVSPDGVLTVSADVRSFFGSSDADINLSAVIKQDGLSGTGSDWDQINFYAGGQNGEMGGWENLPQRVSGYEYDHVGIFMLGGYSGVVGSFPDQVASGDMNNYEFTIDSDDLDVLADPTSLLTAVVLVQDGTTGRVLNSVEVPVVFPSSSSDVQNNNSDFSVFPTLAHDELNIKFGEELSSGNYYLSIYDLSGRRVVMEELSNPSGVMTLDLANYTSGKYIVELSNNKATKAKVFVKQ